MVRTARTEHLRNELRPLVERSELRAAFERLVEGAGQRMLSAQPDETTARQRLDDLATVRAVLQPGVPGDDERP